MRLKLTLALLGLGFLAAPSFAQHCETGCGPTLGSSFLNRSGNCGHFGLKNYPLFESRYIKQFCGPHVSPESCFGYFKPQITPWGQACPNYPGCTDPLAGQQVIHQVPVTLPSAPAPATIPPAQPNPAPKLSPVPPVQPNPEPAAVPPPPSLSKTESQTGGGLFSPRFESLRLPPVADPSYGPPPVPAIPTVPVSTNR